MMDFLYLRKNLMMALIGAFALLTFLLIIGADFGTEVGRYQISVTARNNFTDIYVIDTATGVVKYLGKDEGKPFAQIQGK